MSQSLSRAAVRDRMDRRQLRHSALEIHLRTGVPDVHEGPETSVADENSMTTADVNIVKPARNIKGLVKPNQGDSLPSAALEEGGNHASEPVKIEQKERKIRGLVKPETNDVPAFVKGAVRSGKQKQETSGGKQEKTSTEGMIDNVKDAQDALSRHTEDGKQANCVGEEQSSQKGKKQAEGDEAGGESPPLRWRGDEWCCESSGEEKRKAASERGSVASSSGSKNETRSGGNSQPTEEPMDSVAIARIQRELREREEKCTFSPALNPKSMQLAESKERKPLYHLDKPKVEDSQETPQKPALKVSLLPLALAVLPRMTDISSSSSPSSSSSSSSSLSPLSWSFSSSSSSKLVVIVLPECYLNN
eukprot:175518-Hanusia_phi.AAC.2